MNDREFLIKSNLEEGFEQDLFDAAMSSLDLESSFKFTYFALSMRELIRTIFERLAPEELVMGCDWYKNELKDRTGTTRRQKMLYAIKGGLSDIFVEKTLSIDVSDVSRKTKDVIENLNKYTHVSPKVYYEAVDNGENMVSETIDALNLFFAVLADLRGEINNTYEDVISSIVHEALISDTLNGIDFLATHYFVDDNDVESIEVENIDNYYIHIKVCGTVYIEHQFGSNRDCRRGDGGRIKGSYPFEVIGKACVDNPLLIEFDIDRIDIDTSGYFE